MVGLKKIHLPTVFAMLLTMVIWSMSASVMAQTSIEQIRLAPDEINPGAEYGRSVAMDGDLVAVGAGNADTETLPNAGAVYLYRRHGQTYIPEAKLGEPDPSDDAEFGRTVAIQGNRVFVGARFAQVDGLRVGAVYVYRKYNKSWHFDQRIVSPTPGAEDNFGRALAVQGSLMVVTARKENQNASDVGGAYVYIFKDGSWTFQQKLTASNPTPSAYFGQSVAVQGGLIAIGARNADPKGAGAVYLFRQSENEWKEFAKVVPYDGNKNDNFGFSIAISGNLMVVGARRADTAEVKDTGAVYVYSLKGNSANFVARLTASDRNEGDELGQSVAFLGGMIVAGAHQDDGDGSEDLGAIYLFSGKDGNWVETDKVIASDGVANDQFGYSLAASGNRLVTGAHNADSFRGAAYIIQVKP